MRWLALGVLVAGCAAKPVIVTNSDPDADFRLFRTFEFEEQLGTDRASGTRTLLSHHLIESVTAELEKRGYERVEGGADLRINFYVSTKEKIDVHTVAGPAWGGYYGYRSGLYGAWYGYETHVTQYTEGTLNVDVIDTRKDQLVWEGAVIGRVRDVEDDGLQHRVLEAVQQLFARYPYRAGG
jgi:hypothetical protein